MMENNATTFILEDTNFERNMARILKPLLTFQGIFFLALALAQAQEVPPNLWYIARPSFSRDSLDLFLEYRISDYIPYENIKYRLYDGRQCGNGAADITSNNFLSTSESTEDDFDVRGDGNAYRNLTLGFEFDPETIRDSPIFSEVGLAAFLSFCVQISAYTGDQRLPTSVELFTRKTFLNVEIYQEGNVKENVTVIPEEIGEVGDEEAFRLIGYLCDEDNVEIVDAQAIWAGMSTKVCVTPDDEARAAGIYMRAIDSFVWARETIYQTAIYSHEQAAPLTAIDCEPGMLICSFKTLLKAAFYYTEGFVDGAGIGWLQFGTDYDAVGRRAEIVPSSGLKRMLEDVGGEGTGGWAGAGAFQVAQPVQRLYDVVGFLCNDDNIEIDPMDYPLRKGGIARVCVRPNNFALSWDIKMRSIDSFTWYRSEMELEQIAISPNAKAEQGTTVSCAAGKVMCVFETELMDSFFEIKGVIDGSGVAWLEFDGGAEARRVLINIRAPRQLQSGSDLGVELFPTMEPGFAGASPFSLFVYSLPPVNDLERYICRAYECDENLAEFVSGDTRHRGAKMRVCVAPSQIAKEAGASMWSIEWWTWSQKNTIQPAIEKQGLEARDGRTLLTCQRGVPICFFETRLIDAFFWLENNALDGNGHCWLTFGGEQFQARIDSDEGNENIQQNIDPVADPLYAGSSDIALRFAVGGGDWEPEEIECPPDEQDLQIWWDNEDENMKTLYMAILVLAALALCCILCCCLVMNVKKRKHYVEDRDGKVVLNVGIDKTDTTNVVNEEQHQQSMWQMLRSQLNPHENDVETGSGKKDRRRESEFDGEPSKDDVCFSDHHHPGTRTCRKLIRRYIKENPDDAYGPAAFKAIKKQLGRDVFFLLQEDEDDEDSGWREAKKREIVSSMGEIWREEKFKKRSKEGKD